MSTTAKYPARAHARKVVEELRKLIPEEDQTKMHCIFLQAPPTECRHDTDRELPFHQEANFMYLSGSSIPSSSLLVPFAFPPGQESVVFHNHFIPPLEPEVAIWSVPPPSLDAAKEMFDTDNFVYTSTLSDVLLASITCTPELVIHTFPSTMEYPALPSSLSSVLEAGGVEKSGQRHIVKHDTALLQTAFHIARLTKDEYEIELIRKANAISSAAHEGLMRELGRFAENRGSAKANGAVGGKGRTGKEGIREWEVESENDAEAFFVASCKRMGASQAYLPICASGTRASTLHYVCNDRLFPSPAIPRQPGDTSFTHPALGRGCCGASDPHDHQPSVDQYHEGAFAPQVLLLDAGCDWNNYASDITRTTPVGNGGKYTKEAGEIYELVLRMQKETEAMVKPGIHWDTLHLHAHKVLIETFLKLGIFKGDAASILQSGITVAFYPHGLGHSLGLDVHDSLQYLRTTHVDLPAESKQTPAVLYRYLRIRVPLVLGMVLTVEPGCYFPPGLMELHKVWDSQFVNKEVLEKYASVGGVRIEDVVVVREKGAENLTTAPRERQEIESICSGAA